MEDYPLTLEFEARFSTEEGCREYLFPLRWPEGFRCPGCGCGKAWAVRANLFQCSSCDCQTDGKGIGRIRMRVIQQPSAASLPPFIEDCIEPGSTVHTDAWQGYADGLLQRPRKLR